MSTGFGSRAGVALVAALLTLSAIATLVLGNVLLVRLDLRLAANRQALALSRAEVRSRRTLVLLQLEADSQAGILPESLPPMAGLVSYRRRDDSSATLTVAGEAVNGQHVSDVSIELRPDGAVWRIHIVQIR